MNKFIFLTVAVLSALIAGCSDIAGTTDETTVKSAHVYTPQLAAAADIDVKVFDVGDTSRIPVYSTSTDRSGKFSLQLTDGMYNVMFGDEYLAAFQDSVTIGGTFSTLHDDTLATTTTLLGTVIMDPSKNPRTATIQIMGTDRFANCSQAGTFIISGLAAGEYALRAASTEDQYTPTYLPFVIPAHTDTTRITVDMIFTGIPTVRNLQVTYDTINGNVTLSWDSTTYYMAKEYLIYNSDAAALSQMPFATTTGCNYSCTISYYDTVPVTYYVAIRSKTLETGPVFEGIAVKPRRPMTIRMTSDSTPVFNIHRENVLHVNVDGYSGSAPLTYAWDIGCTGEFHGSSGPDTSVLLSEQALFSTVPIAVKVSTASVVRTDTIIKNVAFAWEKIADFNDLLNDSYSEILTALVWNDALYAFTISGHILRSEDGSTWTMIESDFMTSKNIISTSSRWVDMLSRPVIFNNTLCMFDCYGDIWTSSDPVHFDLAPYAYKTVITQNRLHSVPGVFIHDGHLYLQSAIDADTASLIVTDDLINWQKADVDLKIKVYDFRDDNGTTFLYGLDSERKDWENNDTVLFTSLNGSVTTGYHQAAGYLMRNYEPDWYDYTFTPFHDFCVLSENMPGVNTMELHRFSSSSIFAMQDPCFGHHVIITFRDELYFISRDGVFRADW